MKSIHTNEQTNKLPNKAVRKWHDRLLLEQTERCQSEPIIDNQGNLHTFASLNSDSFQYPLFFQNMHFAKNDFETVSFKTMNFKAISVDNSVINPWNSLLYKTIDKTTDKTIDTAVTPILYKPIKCYVCRQSFQHVHHFYHHLCPECAKVNFNYRSQKADLSGRIALVTGGRIKIGFEIALKLLRAGAKVIVSSRFPHNAIHRYQQQPDFEQWQHQLTLYALDLKHIDSVEAFTHYLNQHYPCLDILINNACQTLRKTDSYYQQMAEQEQQQLIEFQKTNPKYVSMLGEFIDKHLQHSQVLLIEDGKDKQNQLNNIDENTINQNSTQTDEFNEPIDFQRENSWTKRLHEVDTLEFLEAQIINATAPFILNARLKPLMMKSESKHKFIINVSAMEGQFNRKNKTCKHPHTNMAKASLNMMTRTSAPDYAKDNIYMNSVDTGWVTQENPFHIRQRSRLNGMIPPLDCVDGASRVLAPIFDCLNGFSNAQTQPIFGQFLKDYEVTEW